MPRFARTARAAVSIRRMVPISDSARWLYVTRLGEAEIVLPVMLVSMGWLLRRPGHARLVSWWSGLVAGAVLVTLATKVAFIGFGVGVAVIDFTGVSGHAMFAALSPRCSPACCAPGARRCSAVVRWPWVSGWRLRWVFRG